MSYYFSFDFWMHNFISFIALRKAEKEEEKRARERVLQKLEADKVFVEFLVLYFAWLREN